MHKNAKSKPSITAITMGGIIMAKMIPTTKPIIQKTAIFLIYTLYINTALDFAHFLCYSNLALLP